MSEDVIAHEENILIIFFIFLTNPLLIMYWRFKDRVVVYDSAYLLSRKDEGVEDFMY